ncbi:SURF1 family protein [Phycicoccus sp. M110.8]|uniref:SURF1 family cytochrome oxidase biogenesis protein n=1 Tax=Phycicoccus sp. M110.8 TaxID=3075433 RepID=UPI0028FD1B71|nr:SURF1 family protein [Phycicoccus sp. M110.8]MDU0315884.1 SURF1 family protein [Phycicoccus sp. M110.8]
MFRTLTSRRWLGALAVAAVFAVAAFFLGRWQWHRYEAKSARADRIHSHYGATPRPVGQVLGASPMPLASDWTRVTMTGTYAADSQLLVRNRPHDSVYGYEVVVPFRADGAGTVLLDRGWVANGRTAETPPDVPPVPTGRLTVTGWVRQGEPSLGRQMQPGQLASINLREASAAVGTPLLGGYVIVQGEKAADGRTPPRPAPLEAPDTDLGPHQAYAFQWWLAMVAGFVLVWFGARREHLESLEPVGPVTGTGDGGAPGDGGAGDGGAGADGGRQAEPVGARAGRTGRPAKPKKVRIWDEEDG